HEPWGSLCTDFRCLGFSHLGFDHIGYGRFVPGRFGCGRFASGGFAFDRFAPGRFAPGRFAPGRFAFGHLGFCHLDCGHVDFGHLALSHRWNAREKKTKKGENPITDDVDTHLTGHFGVPCLLIRLSPFVPLAAVRLCHDLLRCPFLRRRRGGGSSSSSRRRRLSPSGRREEGAFDIKVMGCRCPAFQQEVQIALPELLEGLFGETRSRTDKVVDLLHVVFGTLGCVTGANPTCQGPDCQNSP
ncbi:MAG: hypothetical protein BJ554DRAFT_7199, partial [Olpidium bornovanus]